MLNNSINTNSGKGGPCEGGYLPEVGSLGNTTVFVTPPPLDYRSRAYKRQAKMHQILTGRVTGCLRILAPNSDLIKVKQSPKNKCHYSGLVICGSFWVCPVCSARISYKRAEELYQVNLSGYDLSMVTTTLQHNKTDGLKPLMDKLSAAWRNFKLGDPYKRKVEKYGIIGTITGTEVRYGANGPHPHKHTMFISKKPLDRDFVDWAKNRWISCLNKVSGSATYESGLDVITQLDHDAKTYITKLLDPETGNITDQRRWTITDEISSSNKKTSSTSRHPFELLDGDRSGDLEIFKDYAKAIKGYQSLRWSPGLKNLLLVPEVTDQDLAGEDQISDEILLSLDLCTWVKILKCNLRYAVLAAAEQGGITAVIMLLKDHGILLENDWSIGSRMPK